MALKKKNNQNPMVKITAKTMNPRKANKSGSEDINIHYVTNIIH